MSRLSATTCQDVSSLGRGVLCVCVSLDCVYICTVLCEPQMSRLSATTCQDVSSLGRGVLCVCEP